MLWALAYLVNPFLLNAAAWDFHPVALAVPFIATGMLAVEKKDSRLLALCCLVLMAIQEQFGITVMGFGWLWWFKNKDWKFALALIGLGVVHACLVLGVIMPGLSLSGAHVMMTRGLGQLSRYSWLGSSLSEGLGNLVAKPFEILGIVALEMGGAGYLLLLVLPVVGLPLAAPAFLLPGLADLAANLLSANGMPRGIASYHSGSLVPVFTAAAIYGANRISKCLKRLSSKETAAFGLIASAALGYLLAPLPLPGAVNLWSAARWIQGPDPTLSAIKSAVGDDASVSVQANVGAHFSQRRRLYLYPHQVGEVGAVVLRLESPTSRLQPQDPGSIATLAHHLQMKPSDYIASIECLLSGGKYGAIVWEDPWLVLARGAVHQVAVPEVRRKLGDLRSAWNVKAEDFRASVHNCE